MDILIYVIMGVCIASGVATAVSYDVNKNKAAFVFKMIASTAFLAMGIIALSASRQSGSYSMIMILGFLPAFWGDYFLARKEMVSGKGRDFKDFAYGVICFSAAQILYIYAFLKDTDFEFSWYFIPLVLITIIPSIVGLITKTLKFGKGEFILAFIYGALLGLTLTVAASRFYLNNTDSAMVSMFGAISFAVSDMALGLYYFSGFRKRKIFNYPVMLFYFAAQTLYALALVL